MSEVVNGPAGFKESASSMHSKRVFQNLFTSAATDGASPDLSASLREYRNLLTGLKLRHEAVTEDRSSTEQSLAAYNAQISDLQQQLDLKSQELEALKSKYQAEEKIVRLAQESFEHPQWIDVGGEEVRMVLNRTQSELQAERRTLESEVAALEDDAQKETQELERRLELTNVTLSTVSELRSKIEMPREQREQIFGREDDNYGDGEDYAEQASADDADMYAEDMYAEDKHAEDRNTGDRHSEDRHTEDRHSEDRHSEDRQAEEEKDA